MTRLSSFTGVLTLILLALFVGLAGRPLVPAQAAPAAPPRIVLPIEIAAVKNGIRQVTLFLPDAPSATRLYLKIHNLEYVGKCRVKINDGEWITLTNDTVTVLGNGKLYGGIGGAFNTLEMTLPLPAGALHSGSNTIAFEFARQEEGMGGFRVLKLNVLDQYGRRLLPASEFAEDDPAQWQAPLSGAADTASGKKLWTSATLTRDNIPGSPNLRAACADCHTDDGRDLKYFNYSNYSIVTRAEYHNLTSRQGEQIASYIRTLPIPYQSAARPWNPPYQPGPGLDSKPVSAWAAGAGIDAVLAKDSDMLPALFPGYVPGDNSAANLAKISKSAIATTKTINLRETPIAIPLLDWNHWLPRIHPKDAWGTAFDKSRFNTVYQGGPDDKSYNVQGAIENAQIKPTPANIAFAPAAFGQWTNSRAQFLVPRVPRDKTAATVFTKEYGEEVYSAAQWQNVKTWGLMQQYGLEDKGKSFFQTTKNGIAPPDRTWPAQGLFYSSPNLMNIPRNGVFRSDMVYDYEGDSWYWLAAITNPGNRQRQGNAPIDYGYFTGRVNVLGVTSGVPNTMLTLTETVLGGQQGDNGKGVDGSFGWSPNNMMQVEGFVHGAGDPFPSLSDLPGGRTFKVQGNVWVVNPVKTQVATALLGAWFDGMKKFTPEQYYAKGYTKASEDPAKYGNTQSFKLYNGIIPQYRRLGVDNDLLNAICDWAKTVWPKGNWASLER